MTDLAKIKVKALSKAIQDKSFRDALHRNAHTAVKDAFDFQVPEGMVLHVVEQSPEHQVFVIPQKPDEVSEGATAEDILHLLTKDFPKLSDELSKRMTGYADILSQIWSDPDFENRFKENPRGILTEKTAIPIDEKTHFTVQWEDDHNSYLVLPNLTADDELTDEELEMVAGGELFTVIGILIGAGVPIWICAAIASIASISWC